MKKRKEIVVSPEGMYGIIESAMFLKVHRCTIYKYLRECNGFESETSENGAHQLISGSKLLRLKQNGFPRKAGRRPFKCSISNNLMNI